MEQGKRAGITLCQILNCLETNKTAPFPKSCAALHKTPRLQVWAHQDGNGWSHVFVFHQPVLALSRRTKAAAWKRNVRFAKQKAESLHRTNTAEPRGKGIAEGDESEVHVCLDLDLGVSFLHLHFTEIANAELEGGCRIKHAGVL